MPSNSYREILNQVQHLSSDEQLQLLEDLAKLVRHKNVIPEPYLHSITELKGLGKEIWTDIDAQDYVRQERSSWNG
jgi:hypothetical protein